jgi:hypothetical protein
VPSAVGSGDLLGGNISHQLTGSPIPEMSEDYMQQQLSHRHGDKQKQPRSKTHSPESKIKHRCTDPDAWQTKEYAAPNYVTDAYTSIFCWS